MIDTSARRDSARCCEAPCHADSRLTQERAHIEIFGDGTQLHWPDFDEDLTVAGLLAGRVSGESQQSLKK